MFYLKSPVSGQFLAIISHIDFQCYYFQFIRKFRHMFSELIHYSLVLFFYTPRKHQKTFRFSDVFRGIEKEHWAVIKIYVF